MDITRNDGTRGLARGLINLSNFPAVARWSRIKDRQMNRSVDGEEKEDGGKRGRASTYSGGRRYGRAMPRTMNPSSPRTTHHASSTIRACTVAELL